jgi:DNA adenine methylase
MHTHLSTISPAKSFGGKSYDCRRIIGLMPAHRVYLEPFLGGGSVLLNKPPAGREIGGDIDLIAFWRHLQADDACIPALRMIAYSRGAFDDAGRVFAARDRGEQISGHELAIAYVVRNRMSRGALGQDFG